MQNIGGFSVKKNKTDVHAPNKTNMSRTKINHEMIFVTSMEACSTIITLCWYRGWLKAIKQLN